MKGLVLARKVKLGQSLRGKVQRIGNVILFDDSLAEEVNKVVPQHYRIVEFDVVRYEPHFMLERELERLKRALNRRPNSSLVANRVAARCKELRSRYGDIEQIRSLHEEAIQKTLELLK
jgi:hypothetical protein